MKKYFMKKLVFMSSFFIAFVSSIVYLFAFDTKEFYEMKDELFEVNSAEAFFEWTEGAEKQISSILAQQKAVVEAYGAVHKILGKKLTSNLTYVAGKDKMLYYASSINIDNTDYLEYALRVRKAADAAKKKEAETIFILPPAKLMYGVSNMENLYLVNDTNAKQDAILLAMQQRGVNTLDLRSLIKSSDAENAEELFYKTDISWKTDTAFEAVKILVQKIKFLYNDDWDPQNFYCNKENYEMIEYTQAGIGSMGNKLGVFYSGLDDFNVYIPRFDTDFIWNEIDGKQKEGSFAKTLLTLDLKRTSNGYINPMSEIYIQGIEDRDRIINRKNPKGPKLLCLREAYFSPMAVFLAPMCSQIDMVWARRDQNNIDYEQLILKEDYDYLIIENYPYNLDEKAFDYFKE